MVTASTVTMIGRARIGPSTDRRPRIVTNIDVTVLDHHERADRHDPPPPGAGGSDALPSELRIRDLSRRTGVSVRNIRAYQDRGLLPAPRRDGRIVWYNDDHVERLGVITSLLGRGFSLANIAELLDHWRDGSTISDVVGLGRGITGRFSDEVADCGTAADIVARYGLDVSEAASLPGLVEIGLIEVDGETWRVPSPRLLSAGVALHRVGVPIDQLLDELKRIRTNVRAIAEGMVDLVHRNVWKPRVACDEPLPPLPTLVDVAAVIDQIRPLANTVVVAELAAALQAAADTAIGRTLSRVAELPPAAPPAAMASDH